MSAGLSRSVASQIAAALPTYTPNPPYVSGNYYFPISQETSATSSALGINVLRLAPAWFPAGTVIQSVGGEVTAAGDAGSVLRLGIYADDGTGRPGALILDAGTMPSDAAAVVEVATSLTVLSGWVWLGGVVQNATTTQPTVRTTATLRSGFPLRMAARPVSGTTVNAISQNAVSSYLTPTFSPSGNVTGAPRLFVKIA